MNCDNLFYYKESNFNKKKSLSNFIYVIVDISGLLQKKEIKYKIGNLIKNEPRWNKIIKESLIDLYWEQNLFDYKKHFFYKKKKKYNQYRFMNKILNNGLKKDRPMWKLYMINDTKNTHLIFKCHHIYGDGYYLMKEVFIKYFIDKPIQFTNNNSFGKSCFKKLKCEKIKCEKKCSKALNKILYFKKYIFKLFFIILIPIYFLFFSICLFVYSLNNLIQNFYFEKIFEEKVDNNMKSCHLYELEVTRCKNLKKKYNVSMNTLIHFIIFKTIQNYKQTYIKKYDNNTKINYISTFSTNLKRRTEYINTYPFVESINLVSNKEKIQSKKENITSIKKLNRVLSNYKLFINAISEYSYFSSISGLIINKFTHKFIYNIYNFNTKFFNVGISNFHSFLKKNKINNREILNIHNFVVMRESKLLFTCCSYNNIINLNIVYQNNILNYKKLKNSLKNVLLELSY